MVDWVAERQRADFDPAAMPAITGLDGLIEGLCAMAELQTVRFAARTRARYALFLELAGDPELGEPLRRQRREFEQWTQRIVIAVGIADPVTVTRAIMALADGLLLHRLTIDPLLTCAPPSNARCAPSQILDLTLPRGQTEHRQDHGAAVSI